MIDVFLGMIIYTLGHNIRARHSFLARLVGTKPQEDLSLENVNSLLLVLTLSMLIFCVLEAGVFFIYNKMVRNCVFKQFYQINYLYIYEVSSLVQNYPDTRS